MLSRCTECDRPYVVPDEAQEARCPHCGHVAGVPPRAAAPETQRGDDDEPALAPPRRFRAGAPAWEQRDRQFLARLLGTVADACIRPRAFFAHLARDVDHDATGFAYLCLLLGTLGQAAWSLLSLPVVRRAFTVVSETAANPALTSQVEADSGVPGFLEELVRTSGTLSTQLDQLEAHLWATVLLAPLTAYCSLHLVAGLVHLSLHSFRPLHIPAPSYDHTFRHIAYAFAPLLLGVVPAIGSFAGLWSFALILIAMRRLHHVRVFGLVGGVLFPVLMLSWIWEQELLPRIARPLTEAVGVMTPVAPAGEGSSLSTEGTTNGVAYPPMPRADRDHSVEVFEEGPYLFTTRTWQASFGRLKVRQLVAQDKEPLTPRVLLLEVTNEGTEPVTDLFVTHLLPPNAAFVPESAHLSTTTARDAETPLPPVTVEGAQLSARLPSLAPQESARIEVEVTGLPPRALLETAPAVGREVPPTGEAPLRP